MADENMNNAPIRVDDDPFVGCINQEYRNSADDTGKPITPTSGTRKKYYEDAIKDEKAQFVTVQQYGAAPYELDEDGNKIAVDRMGDKPAQTTTPPTSGTSSTTTTEPAPTSPTPAPPSGTGG